MTDSNDYQYTEIPWTESYTGGKGLLNFDTEDVEWVDTPKVSADYVMTEVFCKCKASIGKIGLPAKNGASIIQVELKCADCGHTTWWRAAR